VAQPSASLSQRRKFQDPKSEPGIIWRKGQKLPAPELAQALDATEFRQNSKKLTVSVGSVYVMKNISICSVLVCGMCVDTEFRISSQWGGKQSMPQMKGTSVRVSDLSDENVAPIDSEFLKLNRT
jgi:hypothetical protein